MTISLKVDFFVRTTGTKCLEAALSVKHRSFWLQDILGPANDCELLRGDLKTDIAILGGGYVGLWTAIQIKKSSPGTDVTILEQDICGGGASGRNGGFALSWWPKLSSLVKLCGRSDALSMGSDSEQAIQEIKAFADEHGIDVHFRPAPWLWTATSAAQMNAWEGVVKLCESLGVEAFRRLSPAEIAERSGSPVHRAGVVEQSAATLHPAALVRGLRSVALRLGVQIFEHTRARSFTRARPVRIQCEQGCLAADKLIIATNAWAASIKELNRSIVAITSDMVVTAPVPDLLREIGWGGGECITDSQTMVDYYHVTREGRVAFGKGGWGIAFGGSIGANFDRNQKRAAKVVSDFHRYYPTLRHVPITHDWSGPIDRTPNSLPLLGRFKQAQHIIYGVGWSGNGVGPSVIGGKILASLALGRKDRWGEYPLIQRSVGKFPPEPIRYIGAHVVRSAVAAKERAEIEDKKPNFMAVALAKLAPAGLEDKE